MKKENKPLVSVIMNCHNGQKFLSDAIQSIINQTYKNWELIFWDNFSTDGSKKILSQFKDKRIKYFKSKKFTSLYKARNLAIQNVKGEFISFLDTDDMWQKDKLEKHMNFFSKNKDYKIVYSNYYIYDETKKKKFIKFKKTLSSGIIFEEQLKNYTAAINTICLRSSIFKENSFNDNFDIIGDFDLFLKLSENKKIGYMHDMLAVYRLHKSNLSKKKIDQYANELQTWVKANEDRKKYKGNLKYIKFYILKLKFKNFLYKLLGM